MPGSYTTFTETIDLSSYNTSNGKIKFEMTGGGASTRFRDLSITIPNITYTYNGSWSPANPVGNATSNDNIEVISGSVEIDQNLKVNNITINTGATLEISANLTADGDITNNGDLIFKSTSIQNTGTLGPINTSSSIPNVTVERFIPAKRAFRFISSSVTTSSSINENWQENQHNTGTNFPSDNENSNDGFGTHITGSTTGANGFDATPSGSPSLFTFNNTTQTWAAVSNTDSNSLTAGEPYRLMIRGSRAINVTDNDATPTDTRLKTTGNLVTGTQIFSNLTDDVNEFNFVGNPYQSVVNMNSVLSASTNIDTNEYYVWDPNKGTRGGYVTVALPAGTNSDGSAANEYLEPNQAFFVAPTGGANPELVFEESHKVFDNLTSVFSEDEDLTLTVQLVALTNAEELLTDSFMVLFSENYSNSYNEKDASKIGNLDENIALVNGSKILSIERRNLPTANDSLAFYNNNYRFNNYNLKVEVPYFENQQAVLYDNYLKTETTLAEGLNTINFNVDSSIEESVKTNRFSIHFRNKTLSNPDFNQSKISLYPNPFKEGNLTIQTSLTNGENVEVGIYNMLGEQVFLQEEKVSGQHQKIQLQNLNLERGVYIVRIHSAEKLSSKKLIVE
ncbi:T9SS type A sorting domain-containing protein [Mesonia maritima]|uniref:T9SS type A sorting domain-containing protein n=1 Tax=Mesonia maritima TaxID=1793873 RepID=UPI003626D268